MILGWTNFFLPSNNNNWFRRVKFGNRRRHRVPSIWHVKFCFPGSCQPQEVQFTEKVHVRDCRCGRDGTMLITDVRNVLACGNNEQNKLGLNQRQGFLMAMKNMFTKASRTASWFRWTCSPRQVELHLGFDDHVHWYIRSVIFLTKNMFTKASRTLSWFRWTCLAMHEKLYIGDEK